MICSYASGREGDQGEALRMETGRLVKKIRQESQASILQLLN